MEFIGNNVQFTNSEERVLTDACRKYGKTVATKMLPYARTANVLASAALESAKLAEIDGKTLMAKLVAKKLASACAKIRAEMRR